MEHQKMGKEGKKFHMEQTKGTKKPPTKGGFGVMNYNKNGRFRKIHMVEFNELTLDYQLILLYMIYYDLFNDN